MESEFSYAGMKIIEALMAAKTKIMLIPVHEDFTVRIRIVNKLNEEINRVRFEQCGLEPMMFANPYDELLGNANSNGTNVSTDNAIGGPITKMFGKQVNDHLNDPAYELSLTDDEKSQVDELEKLFLDLNDEVAMNKPDIVVRGLARKLGVRVTLNNPESINLKIISDIRFALNKKELNKLINEQK